MSLSSGLPELVGDDESLARFLTRSSQFSSTMAKPSAFLPNPKDRERSVFRQDAHPSAELWELAHAHVVKPGERLYGAAIVQARRARDIHLDVISSEPPPRHGAITGWPWPDDPELRKAQQKELAAVLAQQSGLVLATG